MKTLRPTTRAHRPRLCPTQTCHLVPIALLTLACLVSTGVNATWAQDPPPRAEKPAPVAADAADTPPAVDLDAVLATPGTIQLRDATLADWIFAIQAEWKINIVAGGELQQETVSGAFTETPLRDVLNAILYTRGYGYQEVGNSLLVMKLDDIGVIKPQSEVVVVPLEYVSPTDVEPTVRLLLSPNGSVQSIPSSKSLFVVDLPERIAKVREHVGILEQNARETQERERSRLRAQEEAELQQQRQSDPEQRTRERAEEDVEVFEPQFLKAESVAETVQTVLGGEGRVTVVPDENQLVVVASRQGLQTAATLLERMDVPRPQVRITALLYDVKLEVMERFGFNWSHGGAARFLEGDPRSTIDMNSSLFADPTAVATSSGGDAAAGAAGEATGAADTAVATAASAFGGLTSLAHSTRHFNLNAMILALDQTDGARLLARPTIMAYDRIQAEIKIISEIPVQQLTQTDAGGSIGTTEFREAGITLTVTPEVKRDGRIKLELAPEFSVLAGFAEGQPIIDRRSTTTEVHVVNGQTFVIGGLLRRNELETVRGIPGLMHWKYFGKLFRDHDTTVSESELLIFIKTEIVDLGYLGYPREQMAASVADETVERIPYASHEPFIPDCNDPYCPYHNPRTTAPYGACQGDCGKGDCYECSSGYAHGYTEYGAPMPHSSFVPVPPVVEGPQPTVTTPQPTPATPLVPRADDPPPVRIDDSAGHRREVPQRGALVRLPRVTADLAPPNAAPDWQRADAMSRHGEFPAPPIRYDAPADIAQAPPVKPADESDAPAERIGQRKFWLENVFVR
jgi:general secretion pathway protein D